jgi:pimeloyl-ACP methyl ester carboxylesterase/DNA-binding winged helix-turn-helix (wHTH) protein
MSEELWEFEDFLLDRGAYELRRNGAVIPLQRIPLELLFLLIERRGQLVMREEILERVWGKGVFVDSENSINTAIRKVRRALGDSPEAPRFVVTVPARGYRFIAEIRERNSAAAEQTPAQPPADTDSRKLFTQSSIKYAKSGDVHIAYRIFGEGPRDIVLIPGTLSHIELLWEGPSYKYLLKRLTSFARIIVFDKRGQGLSDRVAEQTLEERIGDVRAVMDAAGSQHATIYGWSEGGPMSLMFAATYPERTSALVLYGTFASMQAPPWSVSREALEAMLKDWEAHWGEGILLGVNAPSVSKDDPITRECARLERGSASPGSILTLMRANFEIDVRHVLPAVTVPTLIMHRTGDALVPVAMGRYLADHVPGAKYVELPGDDHTILDNETLGRVADEIEELLAGVDYREPDRVLATVMFTSIVSSSERAARISEQRQRELVSACYEVLRVELGCFRGHEFNATDDGLFATFDGPARAIQFACSASRKVHQLGLRVRTGLHTGECELSGRNIRGLTVDIAARIASLANGDEVLLSSTVKDLIAGSRLQFADRGMHTLVGVPRELHLFQAQ